MSEIQTTDWDETAANNNQTAPNGMPEGMAPSGVNDWGRETMAAVKRWFNRVTGRADAGTLISSAGTSTVITVTYDTAPASLYTGLECAFKVTTTCGDAPTLNVNSLGAKNIQKWDGAYVDLASGDIMATQHVKVKYDGTLDKWVLLSPNRNRVSFYAHKNGTNQGSLTSGAFVKVTFGTEAFDIGGYFDTTNSRWTPPAGKALITACVRLTNANAVDNENIFCAIYKNGSEFLTDLTNRAGTTQVSTRVSAVVDCNGTDYFEIHVFKSGVGDGTADGTTTRTWFTGHVL